MVSALQVAVSVEVGAAVLGVAAPASVSRDGPIPGFTGGFGEYSCNSCHFDGEENEPPGALVLSGVPERYAPGQTYTLNLMLTRPGMVVGGFQLASRYGAGGTQAGTLLPGRDDGRMKVTTDRGVQYAHHVRAGTELIAPDTLRWSLIWRAPPAGDEAGDGAVLFHAAANAGDGDDSQLGDRVYTTVVAAQRLSRGMR